MDHLKTNEERKARWYASQDSNLKPRYVRIVDMTLHDKDCSSNEGDKDDETDVVKGIPASWFNNNNNNNNNNAPNNTTDETTTNTTTTKPSSDKEIKRPPLIETARNHLQSYLQTYGYAVITNALTSKECNVALDLAWDYIEVASGAERALQHQYRKRHQTDNPNNDNNNNNNNDDDDHSFDKKTLTQQQQQQLPVQRNDIQTHSSPYFPKSVEGGILPFYGSGHSSFAWYVRSRPLLQCVFDCIYSDKGESAVGQQLISSLDGIILWRNGQEHKTDSGWFHIDQNPQTKPNFECIQGLVNLLPVTSSTGGNVLVPKSHLHFPHHYTSSSTETTVVDDGDNDDDISNGKNHPNKRPKHEQNISPSQNAPHNCSEFYLQRLQEINGDDWLEIDPNDSILLQPNNIITCLLKPGDLLLWDSRVVHCSYPGQQQQQQQQQQDENQNESYQNDSHNNGNHLIRAATLVSMMPRNHKTIFDNILQLRKSATNQYRTLTHWANKVSPLGNERSEEVLKEEFRVKWMLEWQKSNDDKGSSDEGNIYGNEGRKKKRVLMCFDNLTEEQKRLVTG